MKEQLAEKIKDALNKMSITEENVIVTKSKTAVNLLRLKIDL